MFTGIIEETGRLKSLDSGQITVEAKKILADIKKGDSIAVNGICLTVTGYGEDYFAADVMPETLRRTSLESLPAGSVLNLERALTLASRLGGHIVTGHIDGAGRISSLTREKNALLMKIAAEEKILRGVAEKGSVALDGISLTVASVDKGHFVVSLIPETMRATNLGHKKIGSLINIETDILGKYAAKLLGKSETGNLTEDFLRENGF